jgi:hypothetical protein
MHPHSRHCDCCLTLPNPRPRNSVSRSPPGAPGEENDSERQGRRMQTLLEPPHPRISPIRATACVGEKPPSRQSIPERALNWLATGGRRKGCFREAGFVDCRVWFGIDGTRHVASFLVLQLAWDRRSQQLFTTCWLLPLAYPGLPWRSDFFSFLFFACGRCCTAQGTWRDLPALLRHTRDVQLRTPSAKPSSYAGPRNWAVTSAFSLVESGGGGGERKSGEILLCGDRVRVRRSTLSIIAIYPCP